MGKNLMQKADRHGHRKGNSEFKFLLSNIGFKNTDSRYLKEWVSSRSHCNKYVENDKFPVKVCYENMIGAFKTWAEACYEIALCEKKKGNKI